MSSTTTKRRGRPPLTEPHRCSVCGRDFTRGGRVSAPALCPVHYHRERRGSARALDPRSRAQRIGGERAEQLVAYLPPDLIALLHARAARDGVPVSQWVRQAVAERLAAEGAR